MKRNVPCQFPFIFNGKTYDACTDVQDSDGRFWCSTKVDRSGKHISDNWGYCSDECFPSTQIQSGEFQLGTRGHFMQKSRRKKLNKKK